MEIKDIEKEYALETYKSQIAYSVGGFKLLALLNGGAIVALLAFLGNFSSKNNAAIPDMRHPVLIFCLGLILCGAAYFFAYFTQLHLFSEMTNEPGYKRNSYLKYFWISTVASAFSLVLFMIGAYVAVTKFS